MADTIPLYLINSIGALVFPCKVLGSCGARTSILIAIYRIAISAAPLNRAKPAIDRASDIGNIRRNDTTTTCPLLDISSFPRSVSGCQSVCKTSGITSAIMIVYERIKPYASVKTVKFNATSPVAPKQKLSNS